MSAATLARRVRSYMGKHAYTRTYGLPWVRDWDTQVCVNVSQAQYHMPASERAWWMNLELQDRDE